MALVVRVPQGCGAMPLVPLGWAACLVSIYSRNRHLIALLFGREGAQIGDDGRRVFFVKPIKRHGGRLEVPRGILSRREKRNGLGVSETGLAGNGRSKLAPAWN